MRRYLWLAFGCLALLVTGGTHQISAFDLPEHYEITEHVLFGGSLEITPIRVTLDGLEYRFSRPAHDAIQRYNAQSDSEVRLNAAWFSPTRHFVNELFDGSGLRLADRRRELIKNVRDAAAWQRSTTRVGSGFQTLQENAWQNLGEALHAIQDFYSHSNWVERGEQGIVQPYQQYRTPGWLAPMPCPDDPNVLGPFSGGGLTSGYFVGRAPAGAVGWNPAGWIGCARPPVGKCWHGNWYSSSCIGINKDKPNPSNPQPHLTAKAKAKQATKNFVEDIINELKATGTELDKQAIRVLLGIGITFGAVIQTDDSMGMPHPQGNVLYHVQALSAQLANSMTLAPPTEPVEWILTPFNDPVFDFLRTWFPLEGTPPYVLGNGDTFRDAVYGLRAYGGDWNNGCPAPGLTALRATLEAALPGAEIFLFTASNIYEDPALGNQIIATAKRRKVAISSIVSDLCYANLPGSPYMPVDAILKRAARETGGRLHIMDRWNPDSYLALSRIIEKTLRTKRNNETLLAANGPLAETSLSENLDVPVDGGIGQMTVTTELDAGLTAALIRPNGSAVTSSDADVTIDLLAPVSFGGISAAQRPIYTVTSPAAGVWQVQVARTGPVASANFAVTATGEVAANDDATRFASFEFVSQAPDGIGDYFPIEGMPVVGTTAIGRALITPRPASAVFRVVDERGTTLQTLALTNDDPAAKPDFFVGSVPLPSEPFFVVVNGTDASGASFQRQYPATFRAQSVGVSFVGSTVPIEAGTSRQMTFAITNYGTSATTFAVSAESSLGTLRDLSPASLSLAGGASSTASAFVDVPADADPGSDVEVRLIAVNATDAGLYNTGTATFKVAYPDDTDGDYFADAVDKCPGTPDVEQIDSDGDGIGDPCDPTPGAPVTISDFSPKTGPVGTTVTLSGTGFAASPSQNAVAVGGVPAAVVSVTATELVLTIPAGAATGYISVVTPYTNTSTWESFVVESSAPVISGLTPTIGGAGTVVTISGSRFDTVATQNTVTLNLTGTPVSSATSTTLTTPVPAGTASGRFTVTTSNGTAVSFDDFFVPPSPYGAGDVAATHRLAFGATTNVVIGTAAKIGLLVFDGTSGQRIGLKIVPGPISGVSLYRPNQTVLATHSTGILTTLMEPPLLPVTGTYQFMIDPIGTGTGTTAVTLYNIPADYTGTIQPDGPAASVTLDDPGRNAVFTFSGTANQRVSLRVLPFAPLGSVTLRRPDGSTQASISSGVAATFMEPQVLATTGIYSIKVDLLQAGTGTVTLELYDVPPDITDSITIGESPRALTLDPGQKASLTFQGTAGQQVTVSMTGNTMGSTAVSLKRPDGSQMTAKTSIGTSFTLATQTLPVTGTYTILVDPDLSNRGSISVAVTGQ